MPTSGVIRYTRFRRPASPSARFAADWAINPSFHLGGAGAKSTPQTGLPEAAKRETTPPRLIRDLLDVIAADKLTTAFLDDVPNP